MIVVSQINLAKVAKGRNIGESRVMMCGSKTPSRELFCIDEQLKCNSILLVNPTI